MAATVHRSHPPAPTDLTNHPPPPGPTRHPVETPSRSATRTRLETTTQKERSTTHDHKLARWIRAKRYAKDFNEVKRLGGDDATTPSARTAEQTQVANYWVESSPLLWNRIARTVSTAKGLNLWQSARLFGLLNMAMSDGYVATFDTKYQAYNYWRPVTAIRAAATDGNPATSADPTWTPLVPTPPIPDYDSGHSVEGGAAATVLARFFRTDHVRFTNCSDSLPEGQRCTDPTPVLRRFTRFSQAAAENGASRILVGFHFRNAVVAGIRHGVKIGDWSVDRFLRPLR